MAFQLQDLSTIALLVFLEGILSIDNALAIALIAKNLPPAQQRKALTYGLVGAFAFRFAALAMAAFLMKWLWVKFVGGGYLFYIAVKHFLTKGGSDNPDQHASAKTFWSTVIMIELTDIAFAVDSILAAVALSPKLWVVVTGGIIGVVMMRFAAQVFIKLLKKFPNMEHTAYLLVFGVGLKLLLDGTGKWLELPYFDFHSPHAVAFWVFWAWVLGCIVYGFARRGRTA